ncbi:DUF4397 domain-containing protein [Parahaliea mediterranea]|uniref:DUF4397 domain-containing protein n=1 Tax=Parahaliea mediterranea TaxID=651086 RepID=A0A939DJ53_9GAMM|nr:DUF4397 domain-containing protein [Parahaliea mediterranea]MBN7798417.1 DUF4397 domain-containing protein [Parahaliea mediterranea]
MQLIKYFSFALLLPLVAACSDGSDNDSQDMPDPMPPVPEVRSAELRVTHASPDAPDVNVYVDGERALENVPFKATSGLIEFDPGTYEVEVRGLLPDGSEVSVIGPVALTLEEGQRTDVVAYDRLFDAAGEVNIKARVLDPVAIGDVGDVQVSVLHAAAGVGTVDVFVTAPGEALAGASPINLAFGDAAGPVALEPDTQYQVRIAPAGSTDVVFDSGALSFPAGTELLAVAVDNTFKTGASPASLLAVGAAEASEVVDVNSVSAVRVVHNSADTPAVDVLVDGAVALDAVPFPAASAYDDIQAPSGTYNVVVAADADNSIAPIDADLELEAPRSYTVLAVGSFAEDTIEAVLTGDERRSVATEATVRVVHGSYLVAAEIPVDVYLTADGVIADAEPAIANLAYPDATDQLAIAPGNYWVTVTAAGDKAVVAFDSGAPLALEAGNHYTAIARDPSSAEVTGSPLIQLTLLVD